MERALDVNGSKAAGLRRMTEWKQMTMRKRRMNLTEEDEDRLSTHSNPMSILINHSCMRIGRMPGTRETPPSFAPMSSHVIYKHKLARHGRWKRAVQFPTFCT
eukprot:8683626-Pyramimonas_sp.AAC.1